MQLYSLLMRADKLDSFRKEIRRGQIDSFIGRKRIRMMQHLREEAGRPEGHQLGGMDLELEREAIRDIDPAFISLQQLKHIAQLAQTEPGIEIIRKADYEPHFHKYLSPHYTNSEEQCYSTLILCNLYYLTSNCPSEALTRQISQLLAEADMRSLENIFFLIGNTISDFPAWLSDLLNSHQFGETLPGLFMRFERPTVDYLNHLVHMVFKVVQMTGKHSSFLKLKQPLLKMIMQKENEDVKELMRKAVYAYYCLFKAFPQEVGPIMVKYGVLARLIYLTPFFN